MDTKRIGNIGESIAISELISQGATVSLPFGDNARYDIIADIDNILYKIQVKSTQSIGYKCKFDFRSTYAHRGNQAKAYTEKEVDFILGVDIVTRRCFLFGEEVFTKQSTKTIYVDKEEQFQCTLLVRGQTVNL